MKYHREDYDIDALDPHWADAQIVQMIGRDRSVLELGCANGYIGKFLKEKRNCRMFGVELNPEAAAEARKHYQQVIAGDLSREETLSQIDRMNEKFDVILCSNVLEHLTDPGALLRRLSGRLAENGFFVIALPNVAHWSVRFQLLFGRFDYTESGILDNTHLKFLTLKSMRALIEGAGLKIESYSFDWDNGIPKFNGLVSRIPMLGPAFLKRFYGLCPGLFAYQFIFKASGRGQ